MTIARFLPNYLSKYLFGDRRSFGLIPDETDQEWQEWQNEYINFYNSTQKKGIGKFINKAGYNVLKNIKLSGKIVVEIGPGNITHFEMWKTSPLQYIAVDINETFLNFTKERLYKKFPNCKFKAIKQTSRDPNLCFKDKSVDMIITFFSLEHLYPLEEFLDEYKRVLKSDGLLVGAVPNEGGLAWGIGRYFTSRRWIHKNTKINYDKIICWEHPNFIDLILEGLDKRFENVYKSQFPFYFPLADINLITRFIYRKVDI